MIELDNEASELSSEIKNTWDRHWSTKNMQQKFFGRVATFYRKNLISKLVSCYNNKYFPQHGLFLEAGSGTAESSMGVLKDKRIFIACDISRYPLLRIANDIMDVKLQADIFKLPFAGNTLNGIYNIGVMEHFPLKDNITLLKEFKRVLKPGGIIILYWPWKYCWVELVSKIKPLFPESPSMFGDFDFISLIKTIGDLKVMAISQSLKDLFIHKIIILKKGDIYDR